MQVPTFWFRGPILSILFYNHADLHVHPYPANTPHYKADITVMNLYVQSADCIHYNIGEAIWASMVVDLYTS